MSNTRDKTDPVSLTDRVENAAVLSLIWLARRLPFEMRVRLLGWVMRKLVAPFAGWTRRVQNNLKLVRPDIGPEERREIQDQVCDNVGRTLIEIYSGTEFTDRLTELRPSGPGAAAFDEARAAGRPVILATGHFGNYDAIRGSLYRRGIKMAALYKPMANKAFNAHYVRAISTIAEPVFPVSRAGILGLIKHLREDGVVGIVIDVFNQRGTPLTFFGHEAITATTAAEWALKYDAVFLPVFGKRLANKLDFELIFQDPIAHSDPVTMTQEYNDRLEALVRADMGQWFWIHRRWKKRKA
ncbi:MAG: lysophospholipid acyltransferase family protein [Pseudomonadota bacterium]